MATLPDMPVNTALTIGALAAMGLIAYQSKLRTQIEAQIHGSHPSRQAGGRRNTQEASGSSNRAA